MEANLLKALCLRCGPTKNPHLSTGLLRPTAATANLIGTDNRNKKKQNINKMRACA